MKRSPLKRHTPLRSKPPAEGEPKPTKPRRSTGKHVGEAAARKAVAARSGGDCEVRMFGICLGRATNWHHLQNRSQLGKWTPVNGLHVCGSGTTGCHGALTNTNGRRKDYEQYGWIVPSHRDPAEVEVLMYHEGRQDWFLLREDGSADLAPWPEGRPEHPDDLQLPGAADEWGGAA